MKKILFLLTLFVIQSYYSQKKVNFDSVSEYGNSPDQWGATIVTKIYLSKDNPNVFLFSFNEFYVLGINNEVYRIEIDTDLKKIDYQKSFLDYISSNRPVEIIKTDDYSLINKRRCRKFIFKMPVENMIVYIDENSKINNMPAFKLKDRFTEKSGFVLPKGMLVKVDIESDYVPSKKDYLLLKKSDERIKKHLYIDLKKLRDLKLKKNDRKAIDNVEMSVKIYESH